jgi:predicted NBD/HSP70 family sugar kinase
LLGRELEAVGTALPVMVDNEANLAALGELYAGGEDLTNFAYVSGALGLDRAGGALGIALADLVNLVDVDTILLGGTYAVLASWLTERIQAELGQRALSARWAPIEVGPALLGPDAAVIGAALTSVDRVRQNPSSWLAGPASEPAAGPGSKIDRSVVRGRADLGAWNCRRYR